MWLAKLKYKFQNRRRRDDVLLGSLEVKNRKRKEPVSASTKSASAKPDSLVKDLKFPPMFGMENYLPSRKCSEDETSIANHKQWLAVEAKKKRPNFPEVSTRMSLTFADRRKDIINGISIQDVQTIYPWLFREDGDEVKITHFLPWWRYGTLCISVIQKLLPLLIRN